MLAIAPKLSPSHAWGSIPNVMRMRLSRPICGLRMSNHTTLTTTGATIAGQMRTFCTVCWERTRRSVASASTVPSTIVSATVQKMNTEEFRSEIANVSSPNIRMKFSKPTGRHWKSPATNLTSPKLIQTN